MRHGEEAWPGPIASSPGPNFLMSQEGVQAAAVTSLAGLPGLIATFSCTLGAFTPYRWRHDANVRNPVPDSNPGLPRQTE